MSRRAHFDTGQAILRRILEQRGAGEGAAYKTWLTISDVPSRGRRHRIFFTKFTRTLHFLSDLERNCGFCSEACTDVISNLEQYPLLPLSLTEQIARDLKLHHPRHPRTDHTIVMTTDQLWTIATDREQCLQPLSVKYECDRVRPEVKDKTKIEAEYWRRRKSRLAILPLKSFTEASVASTFVVNWNLIRGTLRPGFFESFPPNLVRNVHRQLHGLLKNHRLTLDELTQRGAYKLRVRQGEVLSAIYYLIASYSWPFDLEKILLNPTTRLAHSVLRRT